MSLAKEFLFLIESQIPFDKLKVWDEIKVTVPKRVIEGEVAEIYPETGISLKLDNGTKHWIAKDYILKIEPRYTENRGSMKGLK